jgi:hypothetical protein
MSKIEYKAGYWTVDTWLFTSHRQLYGPLATWHAQVFGATSAYVLLGPDICMPGGTTHNPPSASGAGWDMPWGNAAAGGPTVQFNNDAANTWVRGHLINGAWGGTGTDWYNLVAMTSAANNNHKRVESKMKTYLQHFRFFDQTNNGHKNYWYALQYWVQASIDPWAALPSAVNNLYSYCPNMIKVTWRIMKVKKPPVGTSAAAAPNWINVNAKLKQATAANITTDLPNLPPHGLPNVLRDNPANQLSIGSALQMLPILAPQIPAAETAFDGTIEIMQN